MVVNESTILKINLMVLLKDIRPEPKVTPKKRALIIQNFLALGKNGHYSVFTFSCSRARVAPFNEMLIMLFCMAFLKKKYIYIYHMVLPKREGNNLFSYQKPRLKLNIGPWCLLLVKSLGWFPCYGICL